MEKLQMRDMIPDEVIDRLQACVGNAGKMGASGCKIQYTQEDHTGCNFEAGRLKTAESHQSINYQIELLLNGRIGRASGNDLYDLDDMVSRALTLAGSVGSAAHFDSYPAPAPLDKVKSYSESTSTLSMETLIDNCRKINDALSSYNLELFVAAQGWRGQDSRALVTSGGVRFSDTRTGWALVGYVQRTQGTDVLFSGTGRSWRDLNFLFDPDYIIDHVIRDLRRSEEIVEPPTGELPVFVEPEGLKMFLWPVMEGINGRNVAKGDSPLAGRIGERILDPSFTIIDDPHLDYDNGAAAIDDNGIPTRVTTIFKEGVLQTFLYDLDTAGLAGVEPTGHNGCSPYSLTVAPGSKHSDELLSGIEDGLYVKSLVGFGQSNIINGDFSCNVSLGFRVKNGKIVGRVKDTMVAGNIYKMLQSGVILSSDIDPMHRVPYAVIPGMHVSTK